VIDTHDQLVREIRARQQKQTSFNYGISTADAYVKTIYECVGSDLCYRYAAKGNTSFDDVMRKAAKTLTYSNPDMEVEEKATDIYAQGLLPDGIELPKNTLMVFRHVLTTPRKDRDGDILRTQGAEIDPKMLLLWQHVHTLPIGKYLGTHSQNSKKLVVYSAIVDMNDLAHDSAVMIENDMGRFSHGFRAIAFDNLKEEGGGRTSGKGGFDVKQFEVMEESLVSVPSNADADVEEVIMSLVESKKLTSPLMKGVGRQIREKSMAKSTTVPVKLDLQVMLNGKNIDAEYGLEEKGGGKEGCGCSGASGEEDGAADSKAKGPDDQEVTCSCGKPAKECDCKKDDKKAKKAMCPDCESPLNEDGICEECGYGMEEEKAAVDQDEADANNDMGVVMCPSCGTVALVDGKCPKCGSTPAKAPKAFQPDWSKGYVSGSALTGSWENIQSGLYEKVTAFAKQNGMDLSNQPGGGYAYLLATYDGNAVIAVSQPTGEASYYRAEWKMTDKGPKFVGSMKEVRIEVSTDIIEKSIKSGRVLSGKNKAALQNVHDSIDELDQKELLLSKGGRALCRQSKTTLVEIIKACDPPPSQVSVLDITAKDAMAEFLIKATPEEMERMTKTIETLKSIDKRDNRTKQIRALVSR
jgi:hypothetical protein